jgi:peptide/nickel transport system ATP-binding protein
MTLLDVQELTVAYRTRKGDLTAVEGLSFSLDAGKSLGFVGESGCGKTTVGMALMRLLPPNAAIREGRIFFDGRELISKTPEEMRRIRWREMAMIFQGAMNALNPVRRVADQIMEAIMAHDGTISKEAAWDRVVGLFQLVGLPKDRMKDYPHQYSGGMKQRAIIAMALACQPKLIIADEPTTALDVIVQDQILEETRALQEQFGISILFISHDISIVADVCHDIGIMYAGHLVEYGSREEVFEAPAHPYTRALLSSYPTLGGEKRRLEPIPGEAPTLIGWRDTGCRFCERCPQAKSSCRSGRPIWVALSPTHKALCHHCA